MSEETPDLQYDTAGHGHVLQPVLWLLLLIAVPGLVDSVVRVWFYTWTLLDGKEVQQALDELGRLQGEQVLAILQLIRVPLATLVIVRAGGCLAGRGLQPLRQAYFMLAFITVIIAGLRVGLEWNFATTRSLHLERHVQLTLFRAAPEIEATLLPVAAFLLLRKLTRPIRPV